MKLIFCPLCTDVFKLRTKKKLCQCRRSWGFYKEDGLNAVIGGKAVPLGITNNSLARALKARPADGGGYKFESFVIPEQCPTIDKH